ncbi:elongation factor P [Glycocaulis abyssi]|uniref:Elongation factor P n=1 Tax=Glycocaulis abyssi TaxID=1433403 RepID=A0ABV9NFB2_9PROT
MKINGNEIKPGMVIKHQDTLWTAVKADHVKPGKGGAFAQVELKNILDGRKLNERFRSADKVERVRLDQRDYQYLYAEGEMLVFMNTESYEQISLHIDFVGEERAAYLTDGMMVVVELYEDKPIGVELPQHVELEVIDTEPVVKGQTAANSYKPAILTGNIRSAVPPFVGVGERVVVATEDGSYVRRAEMGSF